MLNRIIDLGFSLIGLLFLGLMYPLVAILIKLDSRGPIFYRCRRVGLNGKIFGMYKFRTMFETPQNLGPSVSPLGDPRVTSVGRVLRRLKLNEFPQFINLFTGDMTLVGPRPEAPDLATRYPEEARKIFTVKPGLIGPNQIMGRNEEELYPLGVDPKQFYLEVILPQKLPLDLQYIEDRSLLKNLKYLFQGIWVTITGAIGRRHLWDNRSQLFLLGCDIVLCLVSLTIAQIIRYDGTIEALASPAFHLLLPWAVLARLPIFISFGFYHVLIRHLTLFDLKRVFQGVALSSVIFITLAYLLGMTWGYSRGIFLIDWFCLTTLLTGYRALAKKFYLRFNAAHPADAKKKRILIWGAGDCGELCLRFLQKDQSTLYEIIGFIDDDPKKRGKRLRGIKILGDRHHLEIISQLYKVKQVFIAVANTTWRELQQMRQTCHSSGLKSHLFSLKAETFEEKLTLATENITPANGYNRSQMKQKRFIAL